MYGEIVEASARMCILFILQQHILRVLVQIDAILTLTLVNIQLVHRVSRTRNVHFPTAYVDVLLDIGSVNNAFRPCSKNARFWMFIASVAVLFLAHGTY